MTIINGVDNITGLCAGCPCSVPIVTEGKGKGVISRLSYEQKQEAIDAALAWLEERHEGLEVYAGIVGRPYFAHEKDKIAYDAETCAQLPCPFRKDSRCMVGGLQDRRIFGYIPNITQFSWLPTLIARELAPERFREVARSGRVADIKIAMLNRPEYFPTRRPQLVVP